MVGDLILQNVVTVFLFTKFRYHQS